MKTLKNNKCSTIFESPSSHVPCGAYLKNKPFSGRSLVELRDICSKYSSFCSKLSHAEKKPEDEPF
jgi:hypothetical protein